MEQTLLERTLEEFLAKIDMPLEERYYLDAMQMQAELEDVMDPRLERLKDLDKLKAESDDEALKIIIEKIILSNECGESSEHESLRMNLEPSFKRRSEIYKGLGFQYTLDACLEERGYKI